MGRKPKYPEAEETIQSFYSAVSESYNHPAADEAVNGKKKQELLSEEFGVSRLKIRKILITTGDVVYPATKQIQAALDAGNTIKEIEESTRMRRSTINSFLPYSKGVYKLSEVSAEADRVRIYRERKRVVEELKEKKDELTLWKAVCLFAGYPFTTSGRDSKPGVRFKYKVSAPGGAGGRHYNGEDVEGFGNEMIIEGKQKSISRSTVDRAFQTAISLGGYVPGPKALNVPGAHSYLYSVFLRFGLIKRGGE